VTPRPWNLPGIGQLFFVPSLGLNGVTLQPTSADAEMLGLGTMIAAAFNQRLKQENRIHRHWPAIVFEWTISLDCVFAASLVPETWRDSFIDSTKVMRQVPGESRTVQDAAIADS
jgi:hypothetical protein